MRLTVLVVDDQPMARERLESRLKAARDAAASRTSTGRARG
jgi:DNA-binding LytR/AlgR family response regulator